MGQHEEQIKIKEIQELNDRELQERIALELIRLNSKNRRILDNVLFFFWATIIFILGSIYFTTTLIDIIKKLN